MIKAGFTSSELYFGGIDVAVLNRHAGTADVITAGFTISESKVAGVVDIAELNRHFGTADLFKAASTYRS